MARPLTPEWREWLCLNRDRGCDLDTLRRRAEAEGFDGIQITGVLAANPLQKARSVWAKPPLTDPNHQPRAWRLDTPLTQVYEIPNLLTSEECDVVMRAIDQTLVPSTVTLGPQDYRTSITCHVADTEPALTKTLDERFADLFGVDISFSEPP